ncbi:MAG: YHS domain-containing protein [Nitrososphaerota archaeon]|nr:YHS domain-containing protein [Nitrososphaerota archaeon]
MQKDPVCGMSVDEKKATLKLEHGGATFYFCSAGCRAAFEKDPHKFISH